jgi:hypothetical protein
MTVDNIPQGEPRERAARGIHKVLTEKIISQGESPYSRAGRFVVRPARSTSSGPLDLPRGTPKWGELIEP